MNYLLLIYITSYKTNVIFITCWQSIPTDVLYTVVSENLLRFNLIRKEEYQGQPLELIFSKDLVFAKFQILSATTIVSTFSVQLLLR